MSARNTTLAITTAVIATWLGATAAAQSPSVDTGQSACYDAGGAEIDCPEPGEALHGQDAQYFGAQMQYRDNGDGTVSDLNTGLMWQQTPSGQGYSWADAQDVCAALSLAGHDDWRTPDVKELFSISDFSGGSSYLDTRYFSNVDVGRQEQYWSSNFYEVGTTHGGLPSAFGVNHGTGHIKAYPDGSDGAPVSQKHVRCVREDALDHNALQDNGDATVTDSASGLMWQQNDLGVGIEWPDALAACESLELAGHDDWRLPNVKELQSIVDYSGRFPAIDPVFQVTPIVNESGNADYPYYWTSTSARLNPDEPFYYGWYVAFGSAVGGDGQDLHGAGAVRFDTKVEGGPAGEGGERTFNFVRCVRDDEAADSTFNYWVEIVANLDGANGSSWHTDLAVGNESTLDAEVTIQLHSNNGDANLSQTIPGSAQAVYEDVVALLGVTGKGSLELLSDRPLSAVARIYNLSDQGTFGQSVNVCAASEGLSLGQGGWLLGLRQLEGEYRTNISITNSGTDEAAVEVTLYATDGTLLDTYTLSAAAAEVVQDLQPFSNRAGHSSMGWGYARIIVTAGAGVLASASVIDSRTGDATTVAITR